MNKSQDRFLIALQNATIQFEGGDLEIWVQHVNDAKYLWDRHERFTEIVNNTGCWWLSIYIEQDNSLYASTRVETVLQR
jgi:hypothetical protein